MPSDPGLENPSASRPPSPNLVAAKRQFVRFSRLQRILHICMIVSFMCLALTGLTLKFSYTKWAAVISHLLGGFENAGYIHRSAAVIMFGVFIAHLVDLYKLKKREHDTWFSLILGPGSMVPNRRDLTELVGTLKWFVGRGERRSLGLRVDLTIRAVESAHEQNSADQALGIAHRGDGDIELGSRTRKRWQR